MNELVPFRRRNTSRVSVISIGFSRRRVKARVTAATVTITAAAIHIRFAFPASGVRITSAPL